MEGFIMTTTTSRRAVLAGIATAPALAAPALPLSEPDPIFAILKEHPPLLAEHWEAARRLDEAEGDTAERRPCPLVAWRNYSHIGGSEIERARDEFLALPGVDPKQIEREYREAKAREVAKEQDLEDWYVRNGLAELKAKSEKSWEAQKTALLALLTTRPTTIAGMIALLDHVAAHSGEDAENRGDDILDYVGTEEAVENFYRHLADSLRAIGSAS
jgi:hypothetical protein